MVSFLLYLAILISVLTFILSITHTLLPKMYVRIRLRSMMIPKNRKKRKPHKKKDNKNTWNQSIFLTMEHYLQATSFPITPKEFISILIWLNIFFLLLGFEIGFFPSILLIGSVNVSISFYLIHARKKQRKKFSEQLPDILGLMSNSLKSGYSIMQAIEMISDEKIHPISDEFYKLYQSLKFGENVDKAFQDFAKRLDVPDLTAIVDAILITRETGGNMTFVIDSLIKIMKERKVLEGEIKALSAQGRLSGYILGLLPTALFLLLYMINQEYMSILFKHPLGLILIAFSLIFQMIGILIIRKMVRLK